MQTEAATETVTDSGAPFSVEEDIGKIIKANVEESLEEDICEIEGVN